MRVKVGQRHSLLHWLSCIQEMRNRPTGSFDWTDNSPENGHCWNFEQNIDKMQVTHSLIIDHCKCIKHLCSKKLSRSCALQKVTCHCQQVLVKFSL